MFHLWTKKKKKKKKKKKSEILLKHDENAREL